MTTPFLSSLALARLAFAGVACAGLALGGLACAKVKQTANGQAGAGGAAGVGGDTGAAGQVAEGGAGMGGDALASCATACTDFPVDPILDPGVPADAPSMFAGAPSGDGPCITEPEDGALFPMNWQRPRVKFKPAVAGTLHEIRFHADKEANDVVAYTTSDAWVMPKAVWLKMAANVRDAPITVTVRALDGGASSVQITIAPVAAGGSIVYWAADPSELGPKQAMTSTLEGFAVGDETTVTALRSSDVQMQTRGANNAIRSVTCVGCHSSTPDGQSVAFIDASPWSMAIAEVQPNRTGIEPLARYPEGYMTPAGEETVRQPGLGIFSFSKAHWKAGDRIIVAPYYLTMSCGTYDPNNTNAQLAWLDVEASALPSACPVEGKSFGFIARNGDLKGAANPTWSPDGKTIVYSSTNGNQDGRLSQGATDLYQVPYNDRKGGDATPLPGASEAATEEYYPAFSPDGKFVVFDRVPAGGVMYANPQAELYFVRADGSTPTAVRLRANDPPKCGGLVSPGVNNHWAKWAPGKNALGAPDDGAPPNANGKDYYWLIFSSNRRGAPPVTAGDGSVHQVSQLYATAIVVDQDGAQTFPAIYLWNQQGDRLNTTPAWDAFKLPVAP